MCVRQKRTRKLCSYDAHRFARCKRLVLLFYPLDFTFVCPTELTAFSDKCVIQSVEVNRPNQCILFARVPEFANINTYVVGVSIDSKYTHLQWTKTPRS